MILLNHSTAFIIRYQEMNITKIQFYKSILIKYPEFFLFGFFILLNVTKYFLITNLNNNDFLATYKFVSSDSYDWLANGIRLFENDSISYRNLGLPLVINLLHNIKALFLLPLLNQCIYILIAVYVYRICKLVSRKSIALLVTLLYLLNFNFNIGSNTILADYYAILFITVSVFYLLRGGYKLSFFMLFLSLLFQNLAVLFIPLWTLMSFSFLNKNIWKVFTDINYKEIFKIIIFSFLISLPFTLWLSIRFILFGNPLYSNVNHVELVSPNLDSVAFYTFNSISVFSPLIILLGIFILAKIKVFLKNKNVLFLLLGLIVNIIFWVILYDWNDRRFLIYFIPWVYPLFAYFLDEIKIKMVYLVILITLLFYPTTLPVTSLLAGNEFPYLHNKYLELEFQGNNFSVKNQSREDFNSYSMNFNPTVYNVLVGSEYYKQSRSTWYSFYSEYISTNYDEYKNKICLTENIKAYTLKSILIINNNVDIEEVDFSKCQESL